MKLTEKTIDNRGHKAERIRQGIARIENRGITTRQKRERKGRRWKWVAELNNKNKIFTYIKR